MTRPRRVKKGYPHGYAPSYLTIPNEKMKKKEMFYLTNGGTSITVSQSTDNPWPNSIIVCSVK